MPATTLGAEKVAALVEADGPYWVGVGDGATAFDPGQSELTGTNKERVQATAVRTAGSIVYTAVFDTTVGNYVWEEVGLFDSGPLSGVMLTRKVVSLPEKSATEEWTVNLEVVFAAA